MGNSSSAPAPVPDTTTTIDKSALTGLLSGVQAQAALLSQQLAPPPAPTAPPPPVSPWAWYLRIGAIFAAIVIVAVFVWLLHDISTGGSVQVEAFRGTSPTKIPPAGRSLPRSANQATGIEFTYSFWLLVNNWAYRFGEPKNVFVKGSIPDGQQCPAVNLGSTTNSLEVVVDSFKMPGETITVPNIPADKWMHVAVVVKQERIVDVYVNGELRTSHTLAGVVKQNDKPVTLSYNGGFDGQIRDLKYYPQALEPGQVAALAGAGPPQVEKAPDKPQYFSPAWYQDHGVAN